MPYITAIKGGFISIFVFGILAWIFPEPPERPEGIDVILTVSSFLFAIFTGFFISRMNARYDQLRDAVAQEDALWLSLFEYADYFDETFTGKIRELIDGYYLIAYDYELGAYYKKNAHILGQIYEVFEKGRFQQTAAAEVYDDAVGILGQIEVQRNRSSVLWQEGMTRGQWGIVLLLGGIVILALYFYGITSVLFQLFSILLSGVIVIIILTLRDLHKMRLGGKMAVEESGEEVFDAIGKPRYYNHYYLKQGVVAVPEDIEMYRLGRHLPGEEPDIVLVKKPQNA